MLGNGQATAQPVRLPSDGVYTAQPVNHQQTYYAQPVGYGQQAQTVQYAQPVHAQPVQQGYVNAPVHAQPMQQPVQPVYVAQAAPNQYDMNRYKYEQDLERQRRINAEQRAMNVDMQMRYEQRRRQQEQEEACCCLAIAAVCCAAFVAAN